MAEEEKRMDPIAAPAAPATVAETGIQKDLLLKLAAKTISIHGTMTPSAIALEMKLPLIIVNDLLKELERLQFIEARGLTGTDMRGELRYAVGGKGNAFVAEAMGQTQYVGAAPVSLESFVRQIKAQSIRRETISRADLERTLSHLVLPVDIIDQLGPAVNSARSILLYGKPGNGKTSIAEAVGEAFDELIYIPYCFEVGGQIVNFFDPTVHTPVGNQPSPLDARGHVDPRWQLCKRPFILTGGELTLEMLDLAFNPVSKFYEAPVHLKATNGVFVVDDFGRQRTEPQSVLNRWIVPLERQFDQLTLHTGKKFSVPFDQLVIFSTNIPPRNLSDPGGLRRLYYKIYIPNPTSDDYRKIFQNMVTAQGLPFDSAAFERFYDRHYRAPGTVPSAHHPKYIVDYARSFSLFAGTEFALEETVLDAGFNNLDVQDD